VLFENCPESLSEEKVERFGANMEER